MKWTKIVLRIYYRFDHDERLSPYTDWLIQYGMPDEGDEEFAEWLLTADADEIAVWCQESIDCDTRDEQYPGM